MSEPQKVATYARVSTADKTQDNANQILAMDQLIAKRGWEVYKRYQDHESGGKSTRQGFKQMMEDARRGKFDLLVFWSLDRFSREGTYETLEHLKRLDSHGVKFLSVQEEYLETLGPWGDAVIGLLACIAKLERTRMSERVKAGMARAKAQGKIMGRPKRDIDMKALTRLVRDNWSISEMAEAFGVGRATIVRRKREIMEADSWPGEKLG